MSAPLTKDLQAWLRTPLGRRLYALECKLAGEALAQVFGWQLLQIGLWGDDDGLITEGTASNAWIVDAEGRLRTRDLSNALLHGVTRATLLSWHDPRSDN